MLEINRKLVSVEVRKFLFLEFNSRHYNILHCLLCIVNFVAVTNGLDDVSNSLKILRTSQELCFRLNTTSQK